LAKIVQQHFFRDAGYYVKINAIEKLEISDVGKTVRITKNITRNRV